MKSTNLDNALRRMYRAAEAIQLLTKDGMENDILDEISLSRYCLILRHTKPLSFFAEFPIPCPPPAESMECVIPFVSYHVNASVHYFADTIASAIILLSLSVLAAGA